MNLFISLITLETMPFCQISWPHIKEIIKNEKIDEVWQMYFNEAYSKTEKGVGIVIISPSNKIYNFAFRLEFEASNNVAKYEALLLGLETAKYMGINMLT